MRHECLRIQNGKLDDGSPGKLNGIYLNLFSGEIQGILFSNLFEKAAFIRVLQAESEFSYGYMYINEQRVRDVSLVRSNIHVINRFPMLMPNLRIWENVFFNNLSEVLFRNKHYTKRLRELFEEFHIQIDPTNPISQLTHAQAIQIELIKAYALRRNIIVLADISYSLTPPEIETVLTLARALTNKGCGVLLIESTWEIMLRHLDSIAIIRNGLTQAVYRSEDIANARINQALDLAPISASYPLPIPIGTQKVGSALEFKNISTQYLKNISFSLPYGKLMKVYYRDERSCDELLSILKGDHTPLEGSICLAGRSKRVFAQMRRGDSGMVFVYGTSQNEALLENMSVLDNIGVAFSRKGRQIWRRASLRKNLRKRLLDLCGEDFWETPVAELTPVQRQKLAYSRWILANPTVMVCVNPFVGMDYQVDSITTQMLSLALKHGIAVLVVASFFPSELPQGNQLILHNGILQPDTEFYPSAQ